MKTKIIITILNWTWGIITNIIGLIASLICLATGLFEIKKCPNSPLIAIVLKDYSRNMGSATLGMFCITGRTNYYAFISSTEFKDKEITNFSVTDHGWGHKIQNALVGPLFLLVALCSVIWCGIIHPLKKKKDPSISYYSFWTEKWANKLGLWYKEKVAK